MRWLEGQQRFAHLLRPENAQLVTEIQASVDREWAALRARCATGQPEQTIDTKGAASWALSHS